MQMRSKVYRNIPIGENLNKENGLIENFLPKFLIKFLEKEKETRLIPILSKVKQLRTNLGMDKVIYLKINDHSTPENLYKADDVNHIIDILEKRTETTKTIYFTTRTSLENLEVTSNILIRVLQSNNYANVSITNYGMVQVPKNLRAGSFIDDAEEVLKTGYLEKCEKTFTAFTDRMADEFKKVFEIEPLVSNAKRVLVVPSAKDRKTSKFYNRKFAAQKNTLPPAFFRETGDSPDYRYKGYSDPFDILWWIIVFDYFTAPASATNHFIDSNGNEVTQSEASALVDNVDRADLSNKLTDNSYQFAGSKYETFPEAVEASRFAETGINDKDRDDNDRNKSSSDTGTSTFVAGDGSGGHGKNSAGDTTTHNTDIGNGDGNNTSCTGGCTGGCSGGCSGGCGGGCGGG